ncbi:MAG: nitroreductase family protein, partial [Natronomonas sp.]|nr:nitroreductase family protein [Natronomonas sp.]
MTNREKESAARPALCTAPPSIPELTSWLARRATVREFDSDAEIPDDEIRKLVDAGRKAPTSGTTQMYSFVWIRNQSVRERIHELCNRGTNQIEEASHFLLVCIDLRRIRLLLNHRDRDFRITPMMGVLEGAIDASLAAMATMVAAESHGYGVCPIGNILNSLPDVAATVGAPDGVLPIYGLCIGVPRHGEPMENAPRVPLDAVLHEGEYYDPAPDLLDACFDTMDDMYGDSVYGDATREWQETLERYW